MGVMPPTAGGGGSLGQEGPGLQGVDGEELDPGPGGTTPIPHPGSSGSMERTGVRPPPPSALRMKGGREGGGRKTPPLWGFQSSYRTQPPPPAAHHGGGGGGARGRPAGPVRVPFLTSYPPSASRHHPFSSATIWGTAKSRTPPRLLFKTRGGGSGRDQPKGIKGTPRGGGPTEP